MKTYIAPFFYIDDDGYINYDKEKGEELYPIQMVERRHGIMKELKQRGLLKKVLFDELKRTNEKLSFPQNEIERNLLVEHKNFIQRVIDVCVDRNKF